MECCVGPGFLIFGLLMIYGGVTRYLLYQKISNTPTSKVRAAAVGLVELFGKAKCKDELSSPISKAKCIFWRITGEYYKSGKGGGWKSLYKKESANQFYLEDDTGKMLVEPRGAEIDIPVDLQSTGHLTDKGFLGVLSQKKLDDRVLAHIDADAEFGKIMRGRAAELRVTEYYIAEGDPLYVLGSAVPIPGASSAVAHENLIMQQGNVEKFMYIGDSGESKVKDRMKGGMFWMFLLGIGLSCIGIFIIFGA